MLTIFSVPKPFAGDAAVIQRNALASWSRLPGPVQMLLFGDEDGVAAAAAEFGALHIPGVAQNAYGTPLLDSVNAYVAPGSAGLACGPLS